MYKLSETYQSIKDYVWPTNDPEPYLKYDPVYGLIRWGVVSLVTNISKNSSSTTLNKNFSEDKKGGIKVCIRNCKIYIEVEGLCQKARRTAFFESREELAVLRPHIIKALKWFGVSSELRIIYEWAIKGLQELYETYGSQKKDFVGQGIADSIELIQTALNNEQDLVKKIEELDKKFFDLKNEELSLNLPDGIVHKTKNDYFCAEVKKIWTAERLTSISKLFHQAQSNERDCEAISESVRALIRGCPKEFKKIKERLVKEQEKTSLIQNFKMLNLQKK